MKSLKIIIPVFLILVAAAFFIFKTKSEPATSMQVPTEKSSKVTINSIDIKVKVAKTAEEKANGLSGIQVLGENEGLLFEFVPKTKPNFWMKDMLIPIDIIWISDGKVIGIEKDAPPPEPETPDARLPLYYPTDVVDYVLEVNAGFSDKNNIKAGDSVIFNLL